MLTILRSTPVGRYLQPIGNWEDGLDVSLRCLASTLNHYIALSHCGSLCGQLSIFVA